ncbi:tyramine oxidase subunit B [Brevibacillus sp. B_LB10_24]|uniref:tyramine oxidase subunit B n=1 Tax=Brevibacillus sp. B_LB10_24 TaxID=3380645 RepID=UPI0038B9A222
MTSSKIEFLYLNEQDMIKAGVLDMGKCVKTMEEVFYLLSQGDCLMGGPLENEHGMMLWFPEERRGPRMPVAGPDRRFMSMIAYVGGDFHVCGDKWYGSNIENVKRGLPRSILNLTLNDPDTGQPLAYMSANLVSAMRTGAVPGVAAKYLARQNTETAGILGAGVISKACLKAIAKTQPQLREIRVYDLIMEKSQAFARQMSEELGLHVVAVDSLEAAIADSDLISIATSGHAKVNIKTEWLKPGTVVMLTGTAQLADECYLNNTVVADNWKMHQAWLSEAAEHPKGIDSITEWAPTGQLLKLIHEGRGKHESVINLGDVVTGKRSARKSDDDIILFVTGGMPVYDVSWGYKVYKEALAQGIGQKLLLWEQPHWA